MNDPKDLEQKVHLLLEKLKQEREENDFDNLDARTKELVVLAARKWMGKVKRTRLEKEITALILRINEANAIAHALNKIISFKLQLYASSFTSVKHPLSLLGGTTDTSIAVSITTHDGAKQTHTLCTPAHFLESLSVFRDLYISTPDIAEENPIGLFSQLPQLPILQGVSRLYLQPLFYLLPQKHELPLVGPDGDLRGHISVSLIPMNSTDIQVEKLTLGMSIAALLTIDSLSIDSCQDVYVKFCFFNQFFETETYHNPQNLKYSTTISVPCIEGSLLDYLQSEAITFEIHGISSSIESTKKQFMVDVSPKKAQQENFKVIELTPKFQHASSFDFLATLDFEELAPHSNMYKSVPTLDTRSITNTGGIIFKLRKDRPSKRVVVKIVKGTPVHSFKSIRVYNARLDGVSANTPREGDSVTLPVVSTSECTIVCEWEFGPQTPRIFNNKTRKGEKIIFSVDIAISVDGAKSALVTKDINVKISEGGYDEESVEATLEELIDNPRTSHGLPIRVKIHKSRKLERQYSIEAMIDLHKKGLAKLDSALQVEKMRQERDLQDIISRSPPFLPDFDILSNNSSLNSSHQLSLPRPSSSFNTPRTPPKFDPELPLLSPSDSSPPTTRPRSYSACFMPSFSPSPSAFSPISQSPYKPPKDICSPIAQFQATKRLSAPKRIQDNLFEVSISDISPSDLQESDMEGWLCKKSTRQDTWQRKWFTYQKPLLSYCSSNSSLVPVNKRSINVSTATIARLPNMEYSFAIITRGRVWVLRAENEEEEKEWIHALDPSRMVEESLAQLRKEYDLLRTEMEQKDETISDLSSALDRAHEMASKVTELQKRLHAEQDTLRSELSAKNKTISDLVASLVILNDKVAKEALNHRKEIEMAACEKLNMQNEITSLHSTQKLQQSEIDRLRAEVQDKDNRLKEMTELYSSRFDSKLANLAEDVQERMNKVLSLSNPLTTATQLAQTVAAHFQAAHSQVEALRAELAAKDHPYNKMRSQLKKTSLPFNTRKQQESEEAMLRDQLAEARQNAATLHSQLHEANSQLETSQIQLQCAADEIKLRDARVRILSKHLAKVREEFAALTGGLLNGNANTKNPPLEVFKEATVAHQSHNTYLSLEVQKIEEEMKEQARVYQDTIQRLKDELFKKRQQYSILLSQHVQPEAHNIIQDLQRQLEDLKQKYFISLSVGGKLQHCLAGIPCNMDAFDLLERANQEHITDLEQWPTWISNQLARDSKPMAV